MLFKKLPIYFVDKERKKELKNNFLLNIPKSFYIFNPLSEVAKYYKKRTFDSLTLNNGKIIIFSIS